LIGLPACTIAPFHGPNHNLNLKVLEANSALVQSSAPAPPLYSPQPEQWSGISCRFVEEMRAFYAEPDRIKRDEIADRRVGLGERAADLRQVDLRDQEAVLIVAQRFHDVLAVGSENVGCPPPLLIIRARAGPSDEDE